jgi:hypothetical protein
MRKLAFKLETREFGSICLCVAGVTAGNLITIKTKHQGGIAFRHRGVNPHLGFDLKYSGKIALSDEDNSEEELHMDRYSIPAYYMYSPSRSAGLIPPRWIVTTTTE